MVVSAMLMVLLDVIVISPSLTEVRILIAILLSAVVLSAIAAIWLRNSRLEKLT